MSASYRNDCININPVAITNSTVLPKYKIWVLVGVSAVHQRKKMYGTDVSQFKYIYVDLCIVITI